MWFIVIGVTIAVLAEVVKRKYLPAPSTAATTA